MNELCDACEDGGSSKEEEEGDNYNLEPVMSFVEAHAVYKAGESYFHIHNIGGHEKQNIVNLQLALFGLKREVSN
jgi:hypothetical protein